MERIVIASDHAGFALKEKLKVVEENLKKSETELNQVLEEIPNLPADEREFIKTGATSEEWDAAFGSEL